MGAQPEATYEIIKNDRMQPPLRSPMVAHPLPYLPHRFRMNLVGCCVQLSICCRLKQR